MLMVSNSFSGGSPAPRGRESSIGSRSASAAGRRSGEVIHEEDEDEIEEVDAFSPIPAEAEETIWEGGSDGKAGWLDYGN